MNETNIDFSAQDKSTQNQLRNIFTLLWARFKRQNLSGKCITLLFLILALITSVLFFSTLLIWMLIKFVLSKVFLGFMEWYLMKTHIGDKPT
jgi:hypothetical protein